MSLFNNLSGQSFNPLALNQTLFNGMDSKRFAQTTAFADITDLITKGNTEGLEESELDLLIALLKGFNIEIDIEEEEIIPGKMPSILSSTESYIKVLKAIMEVIAKLKEEEERNMERIKNEMQAAAHELKLEQIQKDMQRAVEIIKSKEIKQEIVENKNYDQVDAFFDYIREEYNIDIKNTRLNPINVVI